MVHIIARGRRSGLASAGDGGGGGDDNAAAAAAARVHAAAAAAPRENIDGEKYVGGTIEVLMAMQLMQFLTIMINGVLCSWTTSLTKV